VRLSGLPVARFGLSFFGFLVLSVACERLEVGTPTGLAVLSVAVVVAAGLLPLRYAVPTALLAWGCVTGFVVNTAGQLSFTQQDLAHLGLLTGLAVAASGIAAFSDGGGAYAVARRRPGRRASLVAAARK
jgi:hypothetical protein